MNNERFNGKRVLVVGGNSGIGLATAKLFKQEGAELLISGRNMETLDSAACEIGDVGDIYNCDVSVIGQIKLMADQIKGKYGSLDVLFISSGQCAFCSIESTTEEDWHWVMDTNLKGMFFTLKYLLPLMSRPSSIVLAGSIAGRLSGPGSPVYAASKAGVRSLARSLGADLVDKQIRVNVVSPGPTDTPAYGRSKTHGTDDPLDVLKRDLGNIPMKRLATPEEVAKTVLFLASSDSNFTTGSELYVDGGEVDLA